MPLEVHIIRPHEFLQIGAHGHFDLPASKAALATLARACRRRNIHQALLDLRAVHLGPKPVFSPADLVSLVSTFREIGFSHRQKLAILYHTDPHHRARLFAFLSTLHGWHVKAFADFEAAFLWLSGGDEPEPKRKRSPDERAIPLRLNKSNDATRQVRMGRKSEVQVRRTHTRARAARAA